jgi:hypothetical protein
MNLMLAQSQAQPWLDLLAADGITVVGVLLVVVVAFTTCLEVEFSEVHIRDPASEPSLL